MLRKYLFYSAFILLLIYFLFTIAWVIGRGEERTIALPAERSYCDRNAYDLIPPNIPADSLLELFPYGEYLCGGQFKTMLRIQEDMNAIQARFAAQPMIGQHVVANALTDKLYQHHEPSFRKYNPDSLLLFLEYAEEIKNVGQFDTAHAVAYDVVFQFWYEKVAQLMSGYQAANNAVRSDLSFRFIDAKLARHHFLTNIRESSIEKFIQNLQAGNWSHLISATWNDLSVSGRVLLIVLGSLTFYAYFYLMIAICRPILRSRQASKKGPL